jgi:hypothetical protein
MQNDFLPMSAVRKGLDLDVSQIHVARAETDTSHAYVQAQNDR